MIDDFRGPFQYLSNFFPCNVQLDGVTYPSTEAAYQAAKTLDKDLRKPFETATPHQAKKMGKKLKLREDWELVKLSVMENLLRQKFSQEPLREGLIGTGEQELVEGNWWGDVYWGVCKGIGQNNLGKLLMKIRTDLQKADASD